MGEDELTNLTILFIMMGGLSLLIGIAVYLSRVSNKEEKKKV